MDSSLRGKISKLTVMCAEEDCGAKCAVYQMRDHLTSCKSRKGRFVCVCVCVCVRERERERAREREMASVGLAYEWIYMYMYVRVCIYVHVGLTIITDMNILYMYIM